MRQLFFNDCQVMSSWCRIGGPCRPGSDRRQCGPVIEHTKKVNFVLTVNQLQHDGLVGQLMSVVLAITTAVRDGMITGSSF